jgi:hypothetical protein
MENRAHQDKILDLISLKQRPQQENKYPFHFVSSFPSREIVQILVHQDYRDCLPEKQFEVCLSLKLEFRK